MTPNKLNIEITQDGKVTVFVNDVMVGMLKEVKLKVMARNKKEDFLQFSAKQLEVSSGSAGMASEFNTVQYGSIETFFNKFLPELDDESVDG